MNKIISINSIYNKSLYDKDYKKNMLYKKNILKKEINPDYY